MYANDDPINKSDPSGLKTVAEVLEHLETVANQWLHARGLPDLDQILSELKAMPDVEGFGAYYLNVCPNGALTGDPDGTWYLPGEAFSITTAEGRLFEATSGLLTLTATDLRMGSKGWLAELLSGPARRTYNADVTLQIAPGRYFNGRGAVTILSSNGGSYGVGVVFGFFSPFPDYQKVRVIWIPLQP